MAYEQDMKRVSEVIDGIEVEVETWIEAGEPRSSCFLTKKLKDGSVFTGSMSLCQFEGGIPYEPGTGPDNGPIRYEMSDRTWDRIEGWAGDNGY